MDGWCREVDRGSGRGLCSLRSGTLGENDDREEKKQRKLHHLHRGVLVVPWPRWGCAGAGAVVSVREAIGGRGVRFLREKALGRKGRVERSWAMDLGGSSEERRGEMEAARQDPNRGNARVRGAVWAAIVCRESPLSAHY
jgi:hypothetical protein